MKSKQINILLIGCGPHGQTFYLPTLKRLSKSFLIKIVGIVELKCKEKNIRDFCKKNNIETNFLLTNNFEGNLLPLTLKNKLI